MRRVLPALALSLVAAQSSALPPGEHGRGFKGGANHHLGDASFTAAFGRAPAGDDEALRMHTHLAFVRAWLGSRAATRPDLAAKRAELLGYLDDYIAAGITPRNARLPWRSPVFIDDGGHVCAVGYLIERSAGRELAETIARAHRYDFLEDIAAAMPAVRAWIDASGLSLEELASIQPGYDMPMVERWNPWTIAAQHVPDGELHDTTDGRTDGTVARGHMEGSWSRHAEGGAEIGHGDFHRGAGTWHSTYPNGAKLAEGGYADDRPHGSWRFYHPSGNLAAEGRFDHGYRSGGWRFYHDGARKTPIALGQFSHGSIAGSWQHFDASGKLLATSSMNTPPEWKMSFGGHLLDVVPGADGVQHRVHEGNIAGTGFRLDGYSRGGEHVYQVGAMFQEGEEGPVYTEDGSKLERVDGAWQARPCKWSARWLWAARRGDVAALDGRLVVEGESCGDPSPVAADRAARIDALLAPSKALRAVTPDFVKRMVLGDPAPEGEEDHSADDLPRVLAGSMTWYVEWPHVDGRFIEVFGTLPGYSTAYPKS